MAYIGQSPQGRAKHNIFFEPLPIPQAGISVLAPDVIVESDGSLLMAAYGSSKRDEVDTPRSS